MDAMTNSRWNKRSGLRAVATLVGLACLIGSQGCAQFVLLSYLIGGPPSIEPDFDKETGQGLDDPEVVVAVVCYAPTELKLLNPKIDVEVATMVGYRLAGNDINVVLPDTVNAWLDQHPDWEKPEEIGRALQATHVIEISLASFELYEEHSTYLFRGRTDAKVTVTKMDDQGYGENIYDTHVNLVYPTNAPRTTYETTLQSFKRDYLSRLSEKIGWLFYERYSGDMFPWAT